MASQYLNTCDHCGTAEKLPKKNARGWVNFTMYSDTPSFYIGFDMCPACFADPNNLLTVAEKAMAEAKAERASDDKRYEAQDDARITAGLKRLGYRGGGSTPQS